MANLMRRDPISSFWPRWMDDFDFNTSRQRGMRVYETDDNIILEAVVAGVPSNNVDVNIEDGVVTIKAEKTEEKEAKDEYKASSYSYYYTVALSGGKWDKAEAVVEDGVLLLTIPKQDEAKPQKIKVKAKSGKN